MAGWSFHLDLYSHCCFGAIRCERRSTVQVDATCFQLVDKGAVPSAFSDRLHGFFLLLLLKESLLDHGRRLVAREHDKPILIANDDVAGSIQPFRPQTPAR